ncbi:MAG TPA: PEP-CTERM sorting domain-containing protein [Bryobacteraceae bacterium]|nr:PEP-CTERM sorting domain-containing protein [Bryobacteraceae bacterium]
MTPQSVFDAGLSVLYDPVQLPDGQLFSIVQPGTSFDAFQVQIPQLPFFDLRDDFRITGGDYVDGKLLLDLSAGSGQAIRVSGDTDASGGLVFAAAAVPEPATVGMVAAAGVAAVITRARRRRRAVP